MKKRTQLKNPLTKTSTKRNKKGDEFMAVKESAKKFRGVNRLTILADAFDLLVDLYVFSVGLWTPCARGDAGADVYPPERTAVPAELVPGDAVLEPKEPPAAVPPPDVAGANRGPKQADCTVM